MKIWKHILVFGVPALVCGVGWGVLIHLALPYLGESEKISAPANMVLCPIVAWLSSLLWQKACRLKMPWWRSWILSACHVLVGATLFGTFLVPVMAIASRELVGLFVTPLGTACGFVYGVLLMPLLLPVAYLHIRLYRYLHARFLAPTSPERKLGGCADERASNP